MEDGMNGTELEFDRLDKFVAEGRLIRGSWVGKDDGGMETACLMAALYPPCGKEKSEAACPASLMPSWLVSLSMWIDDNGTVEAWAAHVLRYAAVIRKVVALPASSLDALSRRIRIIIVREAVSHVTVDEWGVRAACEQTIAALDSGDPAAAGAAWGAAARAAARAAKAAARASWAARAASWASWAARAASWAARAAARAARATAATGAAAMGAAAEAAAADRMIDAFLAEMETSS
jgi:hypothetical protein